MKHECIYSNYKIVFSSEQHISNNILIIKINNEKIKIHLVELINLFINKDYNKTEKDKYEEENLLADIMVRKYIKEHLYLKGSKKEKISQCISLFEYILVNKWFMDKHKGFSIAVENKLIQFINDDFSEDEDNRKRMGILYVLLFKIKSINKNTTLNNKKQDIYIDEKNIYDNKDDSLDFYLDNL